MYWIKEYFGRRPSLSSLQYTVAQLRTATFLKLSSVPIAMVSVHMFEHSVSVNVLGPAHVLLSVLQAHDTMMERYIVLSHV